jgi:hypothetical protein
MELVNSALQRITTAEHKLSEELKNNHSLKGSKSVTNQYAVIKQFKSLLLNFSMFAFS